MKRFVLALLGALLLFGCPLVPPVGPGPDGGTGGIAATGGATPVLDAGPGGALATGGAGATGGAVATGGTTVAIEWPDWDACARQARKAAPPVKRTFGRIRTPHSRRTVQPWHSTGVVVRSVFHPMRIGCLDQGSLGACTGFATAGSLSTDRFGLRLSADVARKIYSIGTDLDPFVGSWPPTDTGSNGDAVMRAAIQLGYISSFVNADTLADMHAAIQVRAGIFGSNWDERMSNPDPDGRVRIGGKIEGGHEYAYLGFDKERGREVFRNSWGPLFGCNGYFWMTPDDTQSLIDDGADADFADPPVAANDNAAQPLRQTG